MELFTEMHPYNWIGFFIHAERSWERDAPTIQWPLEPNGQKNKHFGFARNYNLENKSLTMSINKKRRFLNGNIIVTTLVNAMVSMHFNFFPNNVAVDFLK